MSHHRIIAYGTPAPQGSKKFVGISKAGHGVLVESSKKVKPWRAAVEAATRIYINQQPRPWTPLDGPLVARLVLTVRKPVAAPKKRTTWPATQPDLSKLLRSTEDALTDAGLIKNDGRIVEYTRLAKAYPGEDPEALNEPGAVITITTMAVYQAIMRDELIGLQVRSHITGTRLHL